MSTRTRLAPEKRAKREVFQLIGVDLQEHVAGRLELPLIDLIKAWCATPSCAATDFCCRSRVHDILFKVSSERSPRRCESSACCGRNSLTSRSILMRVSLNRMLSLNRMMRDQQLGARLRDCRSRTEEIRYGRGLARAGYYHPGPGIFCYSGVSLFRAFFVINMPKTVPRS